MGLLKIRKIRKFLCTISALAVIILLAYVIARAQNYFMMPGTDFLAIWLGPHLLAQGQDPYDVSVWTDALVRNNVNWISHTRYLYPLPVGLILLPLGALPLPVASVIWLAIIILAVLGSFSLITHTFKHQWPNHDIFPVLAGIFLFRPVAVNLKLGQIDLIFLLIVAYAYSLWHRQEWFKGGVIIGFVLLKPQVGLPLLFFLDSWLLLRRRWSAVISQAIPVVLLYGVSLLYDPSWVSEWLKAGSEKVNISFGSTPTLWGISFLVCGLKMNCSFWVGIILALLVTGLSLFLASRNQASELQHAVGFLIPAAILITPYMWVYSQAVLILPLLILMNRLIPTRLPYLVIATTPILFALLTFGIILLSGYIGADVLSSLVPATTLILSIMTDFFLVKPKEQWIAE